VYDPFSLAFKYLRYYITAVNGRGHGMHSPFVFDFITTVLNDKRSYPAYEQVEALRKKLQRDQTVLTIQDFGAGSVVDHSNRRSIASIAKNAAKPEKYGQLLYRMVKKYQPRQVLELGTSLGMTTSYLALASENSPVNSLEGAPEVAAVARQNFEKLGLSNISLIEGDFDSTLTPTLTGLDTVDFCFIDGNHRREPTERYFSYLLEKANPGTIMVFDDIHWSREMEQAWDTIRSNPRVRCAIDLFFIGIIFFRDEFKEKQEFSIRF
jgi:predicted O-methyltransferase YrrM